ncbi:acetyl-coenzyme A synthetase 2-like, mitochondrial isoform X2 [Embiotoca jacksoni]|uniref:acetyl-coenzyme A synthetase 2-like, mitochondrial isoform X2 n=1 Tax=Embiotoca jacksoni TaxID=100190 RepID=UPI003703D969
MCLLRINMAAPSSRSGLLWTLLSRCRTPGPGRTGTGPGRCLSSLPPPPLPPPGTWSSELSRLPHRDLYRLSVTDPDRFWGSAAADRLCWVEPYQQVRDCELSSGRISWFLGGKLNVSVNCLDVHVEKHPDRVALIWERDEPGTEVKVTYRELLETTCRLANTLKSHGVHKGDTVAIYMPVSPIAVAAMLACARIGAVHTVVFAGFSSEALAGRIQDAQCKAVLTCNQGVRGGRLMDLKSTVDAAVKSCPSVQHVFVSQRTDSPTAMGALDVPLEEVMSSQPAICPAEPLDSEDILFLLYTSGSTGKPKGIVHTQAGYLLYASMTHQLVFDHRDGDVFGCMADIGWITGHSYVVYGPLSNGATSVLFESTPVYPNPGRYWETVQRLRISQFYGAPTALRLLLKYDDSWVKKFDRSSLRTLGSVGEPINHEAWHWFHSVVGEGRCPLVDTWWQTETGGVCIAPRPAEKGAPILPAMAMRPFFGIQPVLMDDKGEPISGVSVGGALCISQPWPGMARSIYGDHQRFVDAYFKPYPGFYFSGDGAYRSEDGYYQITGRMDDVINVSGHRLGTAEIEDALDEHPAVPETAVIGIQHDIKGEVPFAFVVLKDGLHDDPLVILQQLRDLVAAKIAKYAVPEHFLLPSRLSGGEAAAEDSIREDHETHPQEGCHGDDRRPRRRVHAGRPVRRQRDRGGP